MPIDEELAGRARDLVMRLNRESRANDHLAGFMGRVDGDGGGSEAKDGAPGGPAEDADTVVSLLEWTAARRARGPVFVGFIGAMVMFATMSAVATLTMALRLPSIVMAPFILGGPLLGWLLTLPGGRH